MPHQCTNCGRGFADGSKEMLSGCPNCGGTKFQFQPGAGGGQTVQTELPSESWQDSLTAPTNAAESSDVPEATGSDTSITFPEPDSSGDDSVDDDAVPADRVSGSDGNVSGADATHPDGNDNLPGDTGNLPGDNEDNAQAKARSDMIRADELPPGRAPPESDALPDADALRDADALPDSDALSDANAEQAPQSQPQPNLTELREELNNQFESIKVVEPGQYELNLMELFDREEYIIELQENGHYAIEVPDAWEDIE